MVHLEEVIQTHTLLYILYSKRGNRQPPTKLIWVSHLLPYYLKRLLFYPRITALHVSMVIILSTGHSNEALFQHEGIVYTHEGIVPIL